VITLHSNTAMCCKRFVTYHHEVWTGSAKKYKLFSLRLLTSNVITNYKGYHRRVS